MLCSASPYETYSKIQPMHTGNRLAAVDLGSNSFRLEIGLFEHGAFQRTEYLKETVRQGGGLDENRNLTPQAMQSGWDCLARFGERLAGFKPTEVRAVATQTQQQPRRLFAARQCGSGFPDQHHFRAGRSTPDLPRRGPYAAAIGRAPPGHRRGRPLHRADFGTRTLPPGYGIVSGGQYCLVQALFP